MRHPDSLPRFGRGPALGVFLVFLLLGVLYTAPLLLHLRDGIPFAAVPPEGRETVGRVQGDHLQYYYYLWLVRDRIVSGASFLRDPYQFAVDGPRLNLPNTFLPIALLFVPLSVAGPLLAYNVLVLLSFPLAGLSMTLLAHRYGVARWAALVAGTVFACAPYRVGALLGGHPAGMAYFLAPLALWGLEGALAGSVAGGAWCAAALVSTAILEPHHFYFAALGLPLYLLARGGLSGWTRDALRVGAGGWVAALAMAVAPAAGALHVLQRRGWQPPVGGRLAVGAIIALGFLALWQCAAGVLVAAGAAGDGRSAARRSLLGCLPWLLTAVAGTRLGGRPAIVALALPVLIHAVWLLRARRAWRLPLASLGLAAAGAAAGSGFLMLLRGLLLTQSVAGSGRRLHEALLFSPWPADLLIRVNDAGARTIYLGWVPLALALAGTIALIRRPPTGRQRILGAFVPLLAAAGGLQLGPRLTAAPVFEAAYHLVPFWNFIRQPAKFQILVGLALAVLAARGAATLARPRRAISAVLPALLALLVAIEYHPWRPAGVSVLPTGGPVYDAIRAGGPRVLYVPVWPGDSSFSALYLHAVTLTRTAMLNGYSAWIDRAYVTDVYRAVEPVNLGALGEAEHRALTRLGVRQVVLDRRAFPLKVSAFGPAFTLAGLRGSPFLDPVPAPTEDGGLWVFRLRERPDQRPPSRPRSPLGIHWEAESLSHETGQVAADADASNGAVILARAGRDRPGFLTFGPYRMLPAGPFRAVFRLRGDASLVGVQITASRGQRVLGAREVRLSAGPAFDEVDVTFTLDAPTVVEYRARWDGSGWAAMDAVAVTFADVPDPAPVFPVTALGHDLFERSDPAAEGGLAGYADPARTPRDRIWDGPLRAYPAGRHRLWIRLKLERPTPAVLAWCGVQPASLGPVLGGRDLLGSEVPEAGRYVELAVPFTLRRRTVVEFPCLYRGTAGVWFDRLRVEGPLP